MTNHSKVFDFLAKQLFFKITPPSPLATLGNQEMVRTLQWSRLPMVQTLQGLKPYNGSTLQCFNRTVPCGAADP